MANSAAGDSLTQASAYLVTSPNSVNKTFVHIINSSESDQSFRGNLYRADGQRVGIENAQLHSGFVGKNGRLVIESEDLVQTMVEWAERNGIETIFTMRPFVGVLAESWGRMEDKLGKKNVKLMSLRRSKDVMAMNRATAGFFGFWKKTGILREG